jgi:hypothetical protein
MGRNQYQKLQKDLAIDATQLRSQLITAIKDLLDYS